MSGAIRSAISYVRRSSGGTIWSTAFARSKMPDMRRGKNLQMQVTLGPAMQVTTVPVPDWAHGYTIYPSVEAWDAVNETPVPAGLTVTELAQWLNADMYVVTADDFGGGTTWPPSSPATVEPAPGVAQLMRNQGESQGSPYATLANAFLRYDTAWIGAVDGAAISSTLRLIVDQVPGNDDDAALVVQAYTWEPGTVGDADLAHERPVTGVIATLPLAEMANGEVLAVSIPGDAIVTDGYTAFRLLLVSDGEPTGNNELALLSALSGIPPTLTITHTGETATPNQLSITRRSDSGRADAVGPYAGEGTYPPETDTGFSPDVSFTDGAPGAVKSFTNPEPGNSYYHTRIAVARFNTAQLAGTPASATLALTLSNVANTDNRDLLIEPFTFDPETATWETVYTSTVPENPIGTWTIDGNAQPGDVITIPLDNVSDWWNREGYTGLRFHISGDAPTGENQVLFHAFGNRTNDDDRDPPLLTVTMEEGSQYVIPFSAWRVGRRAPAETATQHTLEDVANRELRIVSLTDNATVQLDVY